MKYKLLKDLPMLAKDNILGYGCWVGGGLGVDMGETKYAGGGSSHNGVRTFKNIENKFLENLLDNKEWILKLPTTVEEALGLYEEKYFDRNSFLKAISDFHLGGVMNIKEAVEIVKEMLECLTETGNLRKETEGAISERFYKKQQALQILIDNVEPLDGEQ